MGFFARPRLSNDQFVQHVDDVLTLSGQTQIATTSGLTLYSGTTAGGVNKYIPIVATNGNNFDVLTYCNGVINLQPSSASGGTGIYDGLSPSTCSVGGLPAGTNIYGSGYTAILQSILVPTLSPTTYDCFVNGLTLSAATSATIYEIGCSLSVNMISSFYRGCVDPTYCGSSSFVAGLPNKHVFYPDWVTSVTACTTNLSASYLTTRLISAGSIPFCSEVAYSSGVTPTYNSDGSVYCAATPADITPYVNKSLCGINPWYWGSSVSAPNISTSGCTQCLLNSYTCKCVAFSTGNITVSNFCVSGEYIWFAIPTGNTKTCWQGANNVSNNGFIPGALFPAPTNWSVNSPNSCWSGATYGFYVSNYATNINYGMTFCN